MNDFEYNPNDPRPYDAQWREWCLCRNTWPPYDITTYPGSAAEQVTGVADQPQVVVIKRTVARWRQ